MKPVNDPSVVPFQIEFIDNRARCLYLGTINRLRRKWLDEHRDMWRLYKPIEEKAAVSQRLEAEGGKAPAGNTPTATNNDVSQSNPPGSRPADAEQPAHLAAPAPSGRDDEIIMDGRRLVSEPWVAAKLAINKRTLLRWQKKNIGPPRIKISRRVFYDQDKLMDWLQRR
jgi:predicted DNA-binding transcriptional regulator AlpA